MKIKKYIKLEAKMIMKGETGVTLSKCLGVSRGAFYNKSTGISDFTVSEVVALKDKLEMTNCEVIETFFSQ